MRILVDTNVVLDVLCDRQPFTADALMVFKLCEANKVQGVLSALSVPNIMYVMRKDLDIARIRSILSTLFLIFSVDDLRGSDLIAAAELSFADYEDALQTICAKRSGADYIVTRNKKDFTGSNVPVLSPKEFLETFSARQQ